MPLLDYVGHWLLSTVWDTHSAVKIGPNYVFICKVEKGLYSVWPVEKGQYSVLFRARLVRYSTGVSY
jgi:hypothetical protein